jgi:hypothetical protein
MIATAIALAPPLVYGVVYGAWWVWWRLPKWQLKSLEPQIPTENPKERADVEDNFRKTAGQLIGGAAVLIGAGFALFQFSTAGTTHIRNWKWASTAGPVKKIAIRAASGPKT